MTSKRKREGGKRRQAKAESLLEVYVHPTYCSTTPAARKTNCCCAQQRPFCCCPLHWLLTGT